MIFLKGIHDNESSLTKIKCTVFDQNVYHRTSTKAFKYVLNVITVQAQLIFGSVVINRCLIFNY